MNTSKSLASSVFVDAIMTDESEYPCYAVWLTAGQISELVYNNGLIADPNFQRGKVAIRKNEERRLVHASQASVKHINNIGHDLASIFPATGRTRAIIPPIHLNLRTDEPGGLIYDEENMTVSTKGRLYAIDGFHRILAIDQGVRKIGNLRPDRMFLAYLYNAPSSYEAYVFCLLNDKSLRVPTTRTAWVSAPYEWTTKRLAYEMAHKSKNLVQYDHTTSPVEKLTNFETVKNASSKYSNTYWNFRVIVDGLSTRYVSKIGRPRTPEMDLFMVNYATALTNPIEMDLLALYMAQYWDSLCNVRPELGFLTSEERQASRVAYPYLINKATARALVWIGLMLLGSYKPKNANATFRERLEELTTNPSARFSVFTPLLKLANRGRDFKGNLVDLFSIENKGWGGTSTQLHEFVKDSLIFRNYSLDLLVKHIGPIVLNSVKTYTGKIPDVSLAQKSKKPVVITVPKVVSVKRQVTKQRILSKPEATDKTSRRFKVRSR